MASNSQVQGSSANVRAQWTDQRHKTFVELCYAEVLKGNRPTSCFNKTGWKNIVEGFNNKEELCYSQKQLKNHYTITKGIWSNWCKLNNQTGIRKDPAIGATDDQSSNTPKNPDYKESHSKPPAHLDKLTLIFRGTCATRLGSSAPLMGHHLAFDLVLQVGDKDASFVGDHIPNTSLESQTPGINFEDNSVSYDEREEIARIDRQISKLCEALLASSNPPPSYTVRNCILELNKMADYVPRGSTMYMHALLLFRDPLNRETWLALDGSDVRVQWLEFMQSMTPLQPSAHSVVAYEVTRNANNTRAYPSLMIPKS